ncbi:MAG TPA: hypothetical protein VKA36_03615 [Solirubrobacterales bacterium]|nr:hypothetical protein [Solirubrobacterales bacterium]
MGRGGRLSIVGGGYVILAGGLVLLGAVVAAPDSGINNGLTAIAGALTIVLAAILIAEIVDRRIAGMIGLLGGLALGISALVPETIEGPEIGRLLGGALLLMGSAGVLSARLGETAEDGRLE